MALVPCGYTKDEYGRPVMYSIDTDDLDDAEYYYYCRAKKLSGKVSKASKVARMLLLGELKATDIEGNHEYDWLTDDLAYIVLQSR